MIQIVATICIAAFCQDKVVASSDLDPTVSMLSCQIGEPRVVEWARVNWPGYKVHDWTCIMGRRAKDI